MKVAVIGAGRVGASVTFALLQQRMAEELIIVDLNEDLAEGEAMDLLHASAFFGRTKVCSGSLKTIAGSDIVVVAAGAATHRPGETRLHLTSNNARIVADISSGIASHAPHSIILVVTNPVDIMSFVAWRASGFPSARVIGSGTVLDSARLRVLIAQACGVSPASVHAHVIGEHGDSELPVWSTASIGGVSLRGDCCEKGLAGQCRLSKREVFEATRDAAYRIIARKGATNHAIAAATSVILKSIALDEKRVLTLSSLLDGIYIGFPVVLGRGGVERTLPLALSPEEQFQFDASRLIIRESTERVKRELGWNAGS